MDTVQAIKDLQEVDFDQKRRVWKPFMEKYNIQKIAEIGVFKGFNFRLMTAHNPEVAVGVDAWIDDGNPGRNDRALSQQTFDEMAKQVTDEFGKKYKIMRTYTVEAAKEFPDEYFDLIYIDADHTYEGCKADIEAWYPKVKSGGFVTGDDYSKYRAKHSGVIFGVVEAVNEFFKNKELTVNVLPRNGWAVIKP